MPTADSIDGAHQRLRGVVQRTPLDPCERLSVRSGARVFLKREDQQLVRSYKLRGAFNLMAQLDPMQLAAGVVTASAGNHAQGVAFACKRLGVRGRIYVPSNTPRQKRERIIFHGGGMVELITSGTTFDAAAAAAAADVARSGATPVPPFDHVRTVDGQGTIAVEILGQLGSAPDVVLVPVGGGGALSGIATYLAERSPSTVVVGVDPTGAACAAAALRNGAPITLDEIDTFVDGAAVRRLGDVPFEVLTALGAHAVPAADLADVVADAVAARTGGLLLTDVDEGAVCTAMLEMYQNEGIIVEPAGALSVAAIDLLAPTNGSTVVSLISGGNNDVSRYGEVIERSLVHRGLKHYFLVTFPQEPGALRRFLDEVLGPDDDITLFEYVKRNNRETGAALVGIELGSPDGFAALRMRMADSPIDVEHLAPGSTAYRYLT
nr:threonine ammonia-lyase IlvA [Millisia brevis]